MSESFSAGDRVSVLLPRPLPPYDYRVPEGLAVETGAYVTVPLGREQAMGVVWGKGQSPIAQEKLKPILIRHQAPPLSQLTRRFIDWTAAYYLSQPGRVLKMLLSAPDAILPPKPRRSVKRADAGPTGIKITEKRRRVLDLLAEGQARPASTVAFDAGVSPAVVAKMCETGLLEVVEQVTEPAFVSPDPERAGPRLSLDQQAASAVLRDGVGAGYAVHLLDGVPGSGKTEVYFEAVAQALRENKQVLVLLPEIALSAQWMTRFGERFGASPAVWHSDIGRAQRRETWRAVMLGKASVVVGARSALFLPFSDLGLIVVDEEHDSSYKQEDGIPYNARDLAIVRASLEKVPIVLASATPSLESLANVSQQRYRQHKLPDRHGGMAMPEVTLLDLRSTPPERGNWLSPVLDALIEETCGRGEQTMLFLNRRGFAPLTLCRKCGHRFACPRCTAWLTEHRSDGRLRCHHCGMSVQRPHQCPQCASEDDLSACGPGVERLAEEAARKFPNLRQALAVSDTLTTAAKAAKLVADLEARRVDLLIGTQIVAKGYHFPHLTLVGAVDADLGLGGGDLRAAEQTFQLLYQVAGRAGRAERPGRVVLQTVMPEHPVMKALASGDRDGFLAVETTTRQRNKMPPYGRLVAVIVSGNDESAVEATARALARSAPRQENVEVLGPAPAPLALLRGRHRRRLLLRAGKQCRVQPLVWRWLAQIKTNRKVRVQIDVDPYSFL